MFDLRVYRKQKNEELKTIYKRFHIERSRCDTDTLSKFHVIVLKIMKGL